MAHLGARAFDEIGGEVVQTTAFVMTGHIKDYKGTYARLVDTVGENEKRDLFLSGEKRFAAKQENFSKIPGMPVAYWVSENFVRAFSYDSLSKYALPKVGLQTGCNELYLRFWNEVNFNCICLTAKNSDEAFDSRAKWFPCNKGGSFRRWYGNNYYVVDWEYDGKRIKEQNGSYIRNPDYYFKEGITWSTISSGKISMRYSPKGFLFETKGSVCFLKEPDYFNYVFALVNTVIAQEMLTYLAPTLDYHEGPVSRIPVKFPLNYSTMETIEKKVDENIELSKKDWDSFETSWDFEGHPLI